MNISSARGAAILFSQMTPDGPWENDFNDWYDHEHVPLRMGVKGFCSAQRYVSAAAHNYLVVYEMESAAVLKTDAYQQIKNNPSERTRWMLASVKGFSRYIGERLGEQEQESATHTAPIDAPYLYSVFFRVPLERQAEFNEWYEKDHVPTLLQCRDWLMVRRFQILEGEPEKWSHLALHYLADAGALESPERERARASSWRARLAKESWFNAAYLVVARYGTRQRAR